MVSVEPEQIRPSGMDASARTVSSWPVRVMSSEPSSDQAWGWAVVCVCVSEGREWVWCAVVAVVVCGGVVVW